MDYAEEQNGEMEALMSIYENEIEVLSADGDRPVFTLPVRTDAHDLYVLLKFSMTPKYPEEEPLLEIEEKSDNVVDELERQLIEYLKEQMEENLGMVMVFTVVSAAIEWLGSKGEELKQRLEQEEERRKEKADEEERKRFEGTKVTIESFLAWKKDFEEERARKRQLERDTKLAAMKNNKLTGMELFMQDASLKDSDVKFLEESGDPVTVDESLFEDLDDLDIDDDDDEDDPDWKNPDSD